MSAEDTVVINDILSFMSCKIKQFSKLDFIKCLKNFYSKEEINEALNLFLKALPQFQIEACNNLSSDSLMVLYEYFMKIDATSLPTFVCKDLNNIPKTDSVTDNRFDEDVINKSILIEHKQIKSQISEALSIVYHLKSQIIRFAKRKKTFMRRKKKSQGFEEFVDIDGEDNEERESHEAEINEQDSLEVLNEDFSVPDEEETHIVKDAGNEFARTKTISEIKYDDGHKSSNEYQKDSYPKVIHINNDDVGNSTSADVAPSVKNSKVEGNQSENLKDFLYTDPFSFIDIEQVFDVNVGHFSVYKCSLCNFSTNDRTAVGQHDCPQIYAESSNNISEERNSKLDQYYCLNCRFKCNSKLLYNRHLQIHPQLFHCPFCKEQRLDAENWKIHVKECVNNTIGKAANHVCKVCGIVYANSGALLVHKGFHDTAKPFECLKCRYRFYTEETLNRHFKAHLLNGFKCPFCHFTNKNKTTLLTHIRCHTGEMPFSCEYCGYKSSSQSALTSHLLCHTDKKTIKCNQCSAMFKSIHKLNAHKITHSKSKIHKCPACRKGFKTGWLMTIHHQRIHLNVRRYSCKFCNYKAKKISALKSHMNTHSNEKILTKCSLCDFEASNKSYLKRHIFSVHRETLGNDFRETDEEGLD